MSNIWLTIAGMTLVTALPRILPITLLAGKKLPPLFLRWLSFVPVCVLSALLLPELVLHKGQLFIHMDNIFLLAALPAALVSWRTGSFFGTIAVGMLAVAMARFFGFGI